MAGATLKNASKNFCMAPWVHTYVSPQGERRMCCASREAPSRFRQYIDQATGSQVSKPVTLQEHWNSDHMKSVRQRMINGDTLPECEVCNFKKLNTNVYRDYFNQMYGDMYEMVYEKTTPSGHYTGLPTSIDYRLTNTCNFKCRTCGPPLSSAWQREEELTSVDFGFADDQEQEDYEDLLFDEMTELIRTQRITEIYWAGGEPLVWNQHWETLELIHTLGLEWLIYLRYNTNLSRIKDRTLNLVDVLPAYRDWQICASLDGIGERGEYIRTGLKYDNWLKNFQALKAVEKNPGQMKIDFTITLPGLLELENMFNLSIELNSPLLTKVCFTFTPDVAMSPYLLPPDILHSILDDAIQKLEPKARLNQQSLIDTLKHMKTQPTCREQFDGWEKGLEDAVGTINRIDRVRGTSFRKQVQGTILEDWWNVL